MSFKRYGKLKIKAPELKFSSIMAIPLGILDDTF